MENDTNLGYIHLGKTRTNKVTFPCQRLLNNQDGVCDMGSASLGGSSLLPFINIGKKTKVWC